MKRTIARGFSIIELLVAIIIIGILVVILIPVVANRTEQARVARVNQDLEVIADAMERVFIDTGFYVRLFALNDVLRGDDLPFGDPDDSYDGITDYTVTNNYLLFPDRNSFFIDGTDGEFADLDRGYFIERLLRSESYYDGTISWQGPYTTWKRDTDNFDFDINVDQDGIPDDPWGNNYILFTRAGMVVEPDGEIAEDVTQYTAGTFTPNGSIDALIFDRPVVLSLGPNGLPGDDVNGPSNGAPDNTGGADFGDGDDYYRRFGR